MFGRRRRYSSALLLWSVVLIPTLAINPVIITRHMCSRRTGQDPHLEGLRDMVVTRDEKAITNSESLFNFWYMEEENGDHDAISNNMHYRYFVCSYDHHAYALCDGVEPQSYAQYRPVDSTGAWKELSINHSLNSTFTRL